MKLSFPPRAIAALLVAAGLVGCMAEPVPPTDPAFATMAWADLHYRLPVPFADYAVTAMRAVPASGNLLIAARQPVDGPFKQVVLLCDPDLKQAAVVLQTARRIIAVAASANGQMIAVRSENPDIAGSGGSIELIDLKFSRRPSVLDADIAWGPGLEFSQAGHLLAASSAQNRLVKLWNLDSGRSCTVADRAELQISFLDSIGYIICNTGDAVELAPWKAAQPAMWGRHTRPSWSAVAFDPRQKLAFGGISGDVMDPQRGYVPAKVVAFNPRTRSVAGRWVLPYPESDEAINTMASVRTDLLMIAQPSRIAIHDIASMKVKMVLGAHADTIDNAIYLPTNDAIYASSGQTVMMWQLKKLKF